MNYGSSRASYDTDNILWKFSKPVDVSTTKLHRSYFGGWSCITYTFDTIEPCGVVGGPVWLTIRGFGRQDAWLRRGAWQHRGRHAVLGGGSGQGAPQVALSHPCSAKACGLPSWRFTGRINIRHIRIVTVRCV